MAKAAKLLVRMRRTKDGWSPGDFEALYIGYGFEKEEGGNHTTYTHEKYRLIAQVARHKNLATGYASDAVKLIDQVIALDQQEEEPRRIEHENEARSD